MKLVAAATLGVALFIWTLAHVGLAQLVAQATHLGPVVPVMVALAAVRFALQAAGWRLAMPNATRPPLLHAIRAVIAGEAAGYLTWGPISREPVKALMVSDHTPEGASLTAAIVERIAYMTAATALIAVSLCLVAVRAGRASWILPSIALTSIAVAAWMLVRHRFSRIRLTRVSLSSRTVATLGLLAGLQEIINVFETHLALTWLGAVPSLEAAIALEGLNRLANAPAQVIPGKMGVLELAGSAFAGALHLGDANGLTLVLARRVRSLIWTGIGILLLSSSASRSRATQPDPVVA